MHEQVGFTLMKGRCSMAFTGRIFHWFYLDIFVCVCQHFTTFKATEKMDSIIMDHYYGPLFSTIFSLLIFQHVWLWERARDVRVRIEALSTNVLQGCPGHALMDGICPCKSFWSIEVEWPFCDERFMQSSGTLQALSLSANNFLDVKCQQFEQIMPYV